jgi:HNH endonuclease
MSAIRLSNGLVAMIDDADLPLVEQWRWNAQHAAGGLIYARRTDRTDGQDKTIYMHRVILGVEDGDVDHKDGNGLNNRRANLRPATHAQALWNNKRADDRYTGVTFLKSRGMWRARIDHLGQRFDIGRYDDRETAADARLFVATLLRGEFTRLRNEDFDCLMIMPRVRALLIERHREVSR